MSEYGVYIPGAAAPEEAVCAALAGAAELSLIDARMILTSRLPKRVRVEGTAEAAAGLVRRLRNGGLDAFVITEEALRRARPPRATSFRVQGGRLLLDTGPFEPELAVHGEIRRSRRIDSLRANYDGVSPIIERARGIADDRSERFLHLYGDSHARVVEIRPRDFQFRALGRDFGVSLAANERAFLELLRTLRPKLRYDDTLLRHPPAEEGRIARSDAITVHEESNEAAALRTSTLIALDLLRR